MLHSNNGYIVVTNPSIFYIKMSQKKDLKKNVHLTTNPVKYWSFFAKLGTFQLTFTCSTLNDVNDIVLVFSLLALNIFHTFFLVFLLLILNKQMLAGLFLKYIVCGDSTNNSVEFSPKGFEYRNSLINFLYSKIMRRLKKFYQLMILNELRDFLKGVLAKETYKIETVELLFSTP